MATRYTCGPLDDEILFLCGRHRADVIFQDPSQLKDDGLLRVRRGNEMMWRFIHKPIQQNFLNLIRIGGFEGVIQCDTRRIDNALISALVERRRPETNTFHMPFGKMTVTLQGVQVLWGLPIEGGVVCGNEENLYSDRIRERFYAMTGIELEVSHVRGQTVNIPAILSTVDVHFPDVSSEMQCVQRARTYLFLLIGVVLFPTSGNNWVHIKYLHHLVDLEHCGNLSWGSVVLAYLHRQLSKATNLRICEISGPMFLLQMWSWERLTTTSPILYVQPDWTKPYGARWQDMQLSYRETVSHVLSAYRSQFNALQALNVKWDPYDDIFNNLPDCCINGQQSWRSETYLICWDIVEPHMPSRVLRQFSMFQPIPTNNLMNKDIYVQIRKFGRPGVCSGHWLTQYHDYILALNNRENMVVTQHLSGSPIASDEYLLWYMHHTVLFLGNPTQVPQQRGFPNDGGQAQMLRDRLSQVYQRSEDDNIRELAGQYMEFSNANIIWVINRPF